MEITFDQIVNIVMSYSEYILVLFIIFITLVVVKIAGKIMRIIKKQVASKTKSKMDDVIFDAIEGPIKIGILLAGIFYSFQYLPNVANFAAEYATVTTLVFSLFAAYILSKLVGAIFEWYSEEVATRTKSKVDDQFLPIIKKISYAIILGIVFIVMLNQLGIRVETVIAAMGIGGLAVALALQPTLSNFFSGVHMVLDRPLKIGDFVELDSGDRGTVMDIGWRSTKIKTYTNNIVVMPNTKLADSKIINFNTPNASVGFDIECGVSYNSDLEKVEKVAIRVAKEIAKRFNGDSKFKPFLRFREFGDSSINFKVIMRTKTLGDSYLAKHEYIKNLKKAFDEEKIEIPFPQMDVHTDRPKSRKKK